MSERREIPIGRCGPGRWGIGIEVDVRGDDIAVDLVRPDTSSTRKSLGPVAWRGGCVVRAFARDGAVDVEYASARVTFADPDIRPELFDVSATAPTWRDLRKEAVEHGVSVTGCCDCPFTVVRLAPVGFVQQRECRFIPDVEIPRDIVGTLSGCPMLHGDAVTVRLRGAG